MSDPEVTGGRRPAIFSVNEKQCAEIRLLIPAARTRVAEKGSIHPLWETIFDAEALLANRPSLSTPEEVLKDLQRFALRQ